MRVKVFLGALVALFIAVPVRATGGEIPFAAKQFGHTLVKLATAGKDAELYAYIGQKIPNKTESDWVIQVLTEYRCCWSYFKDLEFHKATEDYPKATVIYFGDLETDDDFDIGEGESGWFRISFSCLDHSCVKFRAYTKPKTMQHSLGSWYESEMVPVGCQQKFHIEKNLKDCYGQDQ